MLGEIFLAKKNTINKPFVLIKGTDGVSYYCDQRGMKKGRIEKLKEGDTVSFEILKDKSGEPVKNKKGQMSATDVEYFSSVAESISEAKADDEESEAVEFDKASLSPEIRPLYDEFDKLFEQGDYDGALQSELIKTTLPAKLRFAYLKKAVYAAECLLGIEEHRKPGRFDEKVIYTATYHDLPVIKKNSALMKEGLDECFRETDAKGFQRLFNALCRTNTHNTTYLQIALRFQTVLNDLYLPFYVLASYTSKKPDIINEFLKYSVKEARFDHLIAFNKIVYKRGLLGQEIDVKYITKIFALALDNDRFDLFRDFCSELLGDTPALVDWIESDDFQSEKIASLLDPDQFFEKKVIEKYINYYIYKKLNDGRLNDRLLELLSEIAYRHPVADLDEILSNNSYVGLSSIYKKKLLKVNFRQIAEYVKLNPYAYPLACFVKNFCMDEDTAIPESFYEAVQSVMMWTANRAKTSPKALYEIYPLFKLDIAGAAAVEELFSRYLDAAYPDTVSVESCKEVIEEFNKNNCFFATVYFIENRENTEELLSDRDISEMYLTALKNNKDFSKALRFVKANEFISVSQKTTEIIRILYMNFKEFGISPKAYEIFDGDFTLEIAEALALGNFMSTNGTPVILMGIYYKKNDIVRAAYLHSLFYNVTNTGNKLFYKQLHKADGRISSADCRYKAIRMAFSRYDRKGLFSFFEWTSKIVIDSRYSDKFEMYKLQLDILLRDPSEKDSWQKLLIRLAANNQEQTNSPFEYAVLSMYLLHFYGLTGEDALNTEEENKKLYEERKAAEAYIDRLSRFAAFSRVNETSNFIKLNNELFGIMPEAYILKLSDFFEQNKALFVRNTEIEAADIERLYLQLLEKYNDSLEEDYIYFAISLYEAFSSRIAPHLELYKSFCRSSNEKSALFRSLFRLYSPENVPVFRDFLYNNDWNCTGEEADVLALLKIVYSSDGDKLPSDIARLDNRCLELFRRDASLLLQNYPVLTGCNSFIESDESTAYKYLVLKYVTEIAFDQDLYWDVSHKYWDSNDDTDVWEKLSSDPIGGINAALGYFKAAYKKQTYNAQNLGVEYISRRYNNLFIIDLYTALSENRSISSVNDEYIIELMKKNEHTSLIYDKIYKVLKELLSELCGSSLSRNCKTALLFAVIRGTLFPVIYDEETFNELLQKTELHVRIKQLFEMTGYPSFSQSALYIHINNKTRLDILAFCKVFLPTAYSAITAFEALSDENDKMRMRDFIEYASTEMNRKQFMLTVLEEYAQSYNETEYRTYKPVLTNVIIATVFNYNVVRDLGNAVRLGKTVYSPEFFRDLLEAMNKKSVYWYLLAVKQALRKNKNEAAAAYYQISDIREIPEIWSGEAQNLKKYINGEIPEFTTFGINNDFSAQKETAIEKTVLIEIAQSLVPEKINNAEAKSALGAFSDPNRSAQEKLNAGSAVLSYVKDDDVQFADSISKGSVRGGGESLTYNEFLFEFGLITVRAKNISANKKMDVIVELFRFFELLNDKNRRKFRERLNNAFLNFFTTVKPSDNLISYEQWISKAAAVRDIVEKNKIELEGYDFFLSNLEKCVAFEAEAYTAMEKIHFLSTLPDGISVSPVTRNFLNAAKKESERLKNGVMAKISVNSTEIENNSVFIMIENPEDSKTAINLAPEAGVTKLFVSVFNKRTDKKPVVLERLCSGYTKIIRPGQISAERILLPEKYITDGWADGDSVDIRIVLEVRGEKICSNSDNSVFFTYRRESEKEEITPAKYKYKIDTGAFTPGNRGFGRTSEIQWLNDHIPVQNLTVIYGPSRVGKSSLLRYIENFLAVDYKHNRGSFESFEKNIDTLYVISHEVKYQSLPEQETDKLSYLFIEPIREAFKDIIAPDTSDGDIDDDNIPEESIERIINILNKPDKDVSIEKKLKKISKELSKNKAEIWVLIDEFQRILRDSSVTKSPAFRDFCKSLGDTNGCIRYVICGADELVKLMINKDSIFMYGDNTRPIGQFDPEKDKDGYFDMLRDPQVWGGVKPPFTREALEYIFSYTAGNALYGKMIGNKVIDAVRDGDFRKRKRIYPFDISQVIAKMLTEKKNDIDNSAEVNMFIGNVTKNLEAEEKYLLLIARMMLDDENRTSVSIREIYDYFGALENAAVKAETDTALHLCSVRGILKWENKNGESLYSFSTPFYFTQYEELLETKGVPERADAVSEEPENKRMSLDELEAELIARPHKELEELKERQPSIFKSGEKHITNIEKVGKYVSGDDKSSHFEVKIENMTNAFNQILSGITGEELLKSFTELPRLEQYCGENALPELISRAENGDSEAEEQLTQSTDKMISDYRTVLVSQEEKEDFCVWNILGIHKDEYDYLSSKVSPSFMTDLFFAAKLESVFNIIDNDESIDADKKDFSPVSIMYCKIVEKMLKLYHTDVYIRRLPGASAEQKYNNSPVKFGDLKNPKIRNKVGKKITMGAFLYPINPNFSPEAAYNSLGKTDERRAGWRVHGSMLKKVTDIRNKSAHGVKDTVVDSSLLKELKTELFDNEGLLNIVTLSE